MYRPLLLILLGYFLFQRINNTQHTDQIDNKTKKICYCIKGLIATEKAWAVCHDRGKWCTIFSAHLERSVFVAHLMMRISGTQKREPLICRQNKKSLTWTIIKNALELSDQKWSFSNFVWRYGGNMFNIHSIEPIYHSVVYPKYCRFVYKFKELNWFFPYY